MITSNLNQNPLYVNAALLLPAWTASISLPDMIKLANAKPYQDTPRSRWEARKVIGKR